MTKDVLKKANSALNYKTKDHIEGFSRLQAYMEALKNFNPSMNFEIQLDDGIFKRMFFTMPHAAEVFNHSYKVLGFDTAFMKPLDVSSVHEDIKSILFEGHLNDRLVLETKLMEN